MISFQAQASRDISLPPQALFTIPGLETKGTIPDRFLKRRTAVQTTFLQTKGMKHEKQHHYQYNRKTQYIEPSDYTTAGSYCAGYSHNLYPRSTLHTDPCQSRTDLPYESGTADQRICTRMERRRGKLYRSAPPACLSSPDSPAVPPRLQAPPEDIFSALSS